MTRNGRRELLFVLVASAAITMVACLLSPHLTPGHPAFAYPSDHHKYIRMAQEGLFRFQIAPYSWRIAVPFLCGALPLDTTRAFLLVTMLSIWLTGVAVFWLVRSDPLARGPGAREALGAASSWATNPTPAAYLVLMLYFTMSWVVRFDLYDFWLPDAAAALFTVLALQAAMDRRPLRLAILLAIGVTIRESVIFVAPVYWSWNAGRAAADSRPDRRPDRRFGRLAASLARLAPARLRLPAGTLALAVPAIAILAALRLGLPDLNGTAASAGMPERLTRIGPGVPVYGPLAGFADLLQSRLAGLSPKQILIYLVRPFGVAPFALALLGLPGRWRAALRLLPFVLLVYAQLLVARNDDRLLALAFPAVLLLATGGIERIARVIGPAALAIFLGAFFAIQYMGREMYAAPFGLQAALGAAEAGIICAVWIWKRRQAPRPGF